MWPRREDPSLVRVDAIKRHREAQYREARQDFAKAIESLRRRLDEVPVDVNFPDLGREMRRTVS